MQSKIYDSTKSNAATFPISSSESQTTYYRARNNLNFLNFLNLFGYAINFTFVSGTGTWFLKDLPGIGTVSNDYQVCHIEIYPLCHLRLS